MLAGGVWADRLRRQYVMLTADAVRGVVQATLAVLLLTGHAHVWELGVGAALYGAATSFFDPASIALVPETVPTAELQQANSLLGLPQSFFSIGRARRGRGTDRGLRHRLAVRRRRRHLLREPGLPGAAAGAAAVDAAARVVPGRPRRRLARARDPPLVLDHAGRARLRQLRAARLLRARPGHRRALARRRLRLGRHLGRVGGRGDRRGAGRAAGQAAAAARGRDPADA